MRFLALLLLGCLPTFASVIYDNGSPDHIDGQFLGGPYIAQDFTLGTGSTINGVQFWDFTATTSPTSTLTIDWALYSNSGNIPGTPLFSGTASAARTYLGLLQPTVAEFQDVITLPDISLAAGTYWLVLNNALATPGGNVVYWESTGANGTLAALRWDGTQWVHDGTEFAFQLTDVPEPATWGTVAAGVAIAMLKRRRRSGQIQHLR